MDIPECLSYSTLQGFLLHFIRKTNNNKLFGRPSSLDEQIAWPQIPEAPVSRVCLHQGPDAAALGCMSFGISGQLRCQNLK